MSFWVYTTADKDGKPQITAVSRVHPLHILREFRHDVPDEYLIFMTEITEEEFNSWATDEEDEGERRIETESQLLGYTISPAPVIPEDNSHWTTWEGAPPSKNPGR